VVLYVLLRAAKLARPHAIGYILLRVFLPDFPMTDPLIYTHVGAFLQPVRGWHNQRQKNPAPA
jgi:hypothetical protein